MTINCREREKNYVGNSATNFFEEIDRFWVRSKPKRTIKRKKTEDELFCNSRTNQEQFLLFRPLRKRSCFKRKHFLSKQRFFLKLLPTTWRKDKRKLHAVFFPPLEAMSSVFTKMKCISRSKPFRCDPVKPSREKWRKIIIFLLRKGYMLSS